MSLQVAVKAYETCRSVYEKTSTQYAEADSLWAYGCNSGMWPGQGLMAASAETLRRDADDAYQAMITAYANVLRLRYDTTRQQVSMPILRNAAPVIFANAIAEAGILCVDLLRRLLGGETSYCRVIFSALCDVCKDLGVRVGQPILLAAHEAIEREDMSLAWCLADYVALTEQEHEARCAYLADKY